MFRNFQTLFVRRFCSNKDVPGPPVNPIEKTVASNEFVNLPPSPESISAASTNTLSGCESSLDSKVNTSTRISISVPPFLFPRKECFQKQPPDAIISHQTPR
eukprot:Sdes_comp24133_c0_seq1m22170